jgi:hypothetical protein
VSSRKANLDLAIAQAKQRLSDLGAAAKLPEEVQETKQKGLPPKSRLNRLLGKQSVPDTRRGTLLQRVGVVERPTYDLVADAVLGKESRLHQPSLNLHTDDGSLASIVSSRLKSLRERTAESIEEGQMPLDKDDFFVGMETDGRPVWESVLDHQRGRTIHELPESLAQPEPGTLFHHSVMAPVDAPWPVKLRPESRLSFKQWFTIEENLQATQAAEAVVDSPGMALNPLVLIGPSESGRSHLIHAISQGVLRRQEGEVYLLAASDLLQFEHLPQGWQEAMSQARMIAIDDTHLMADHPVSSAMLGTMVDYALNMGVHVVLTTSIDPERWPASRLWELVRSAAKVRLHKPAATSMVLFARQLALKRSLMLDDGQLASVVLHHEIGWRATKANLDMVALALESGQELLDGDDVTSVPSGEPVHSNQVMPQIERENVADIATKLISEAVDVVYSDTAIGGIELHSQLPEIGDDTYEPPHFDTESMARNAQSRHEAYMKTALHDLNLKVPSVLDLDERDAHLVARSGRIEERDYSTAADILTDLDETIDRTLGSFESEIASRSMHLEQLEQRMMDLAQQTSEATIEELIQIADDLRHLEEELVEIDPERGPLPPFEEDVIESKKRSVGRRKNPPKNDPIPSELDSFTPEGEWDVDAGSVDMLDLLDNTEKSQRKITLSTISAVQSKPDGEEE